MEHRVCSLLTHHIVLWLPIYLFVLDTGLKALCRLYSIPCWVPSPSTFFGTWKVKWKLLSRVWLFATPWTIQSMEFSRPEYWSGWLFSSPGDLPNPGTEPTSPALQVDSLLSEPPGKTSPLSSVFLAHDSHGRILKPLFIHSLKISVLPGPTSRSCLMH